MKLIWTRQIVPPGAHQLAFPAFEMSVVCSKSHLVLLPRPTFHTPRMDFSLWFVRPLWFPLLDSFLWLEVKPFLACCFQECAVCVTECYMGGFYSIFLEWNGSHPAWLCACINRGTRKPAFNIQNMNQPPPCATPSCFDERLLTAPQTMPWGPANHLIPLLYPRHRWGQSSLPGTISFQLPAALSFLGFSYLCHPLLMTLGQRGQGEHGKPEVYS